ncbi:antitoxin [Spirochaeta dissipatitropha]
MVKTKTFMSGRSQAIRLPKEYRFNEEEIYMNKIDDILVIVEKNKLWDVFDRSVNNFTEDFMSDRGIEVADKREIF